MKITVAGNKKEYEDGITVAELIVKENVENQNTVYLHPQILSFFPDE